MPCLISLFYIKPQHGGGILHLLGIVLYLSSTSNHNCTSLQQNLLKLSYISLLHQTTTRLRRYTRLASLSYISLLHQTTTYMQSKLESCQLSYISLLHQTTTDWMLLFARFQLSYISLLHQTTTISMHIQPCLQLSYISLLHQTTTGDVENESLVGLSYISLLHQTTTQQLDCFPLHHCLISLFYIKPQPGACSQAHGIIVLYLSSTSNHNLGHAVVAGEPIVLYLSSTSNHNHLMLHRIAMRLSYISLLHQTTTAKKQAQIDKYCLISLFYIKPQHAGAAGRSKDNCLISLFYIKPQLRQHSWSRRTYCLISLFYIKPQLASVAMRGLSIVLYLSSTSNHNARHT